MATPNETSTNPQVTGNPEDAQFIFTEAATHSSAPTSDSGVEGGFGSARDLDGDGIVDTIEIDLDSDGDADQITHDFDGDGVADVVETSTAGDGRFDVIDIDSNGDGYADITQIDVDNDGRIDGVVLDTNFDGLADEADFDSDGDGRVDTVIVDTNGDGILDFAGIDVTSASTNVKSSVTQSMWSIPARSHARRTNHAVISSSFSTSADSNTSSNLRSIRGIKHGNQRVTSRDLAAV
ncbi:hypothetical protein [Rhodococcus qingshengii]|uniref:hypothetical protein n=1 Tax=Rhodococcus qingshengii TaxID=334542 RepID=UPI001BE97137|nr:hypothetical protein [Rhodococcus qingshengii]MBT2273802.1 hypothetical protein [Rhodococcus qingshengii]